MTADIGVNEELIKPSLPQFEETQAELLDISPSNKRRIQENKFVDPEKILQETFQQTRNVIQFSRGLNNLLKIGQVSDYYNEENSIDNWDHHKESRIAYLLKKARKTRTDTEAIYENIREFPAFASFIETSMSEVEDEGIFQICKHMIYEKAGPGEWIMREGDDSNDKFYIILSGSVSIVLKNRNVYAEENIQEIKRLEEEQAEQEEKEKKSRRATKGKQKPKLNRNEAYARGALKLGGDDINALRHIASELIADSSPRNNKKAKAAVPSEFSKTAARHSQKFMTSDDHNHRGSKFQHVGSYGELSKVEEDHAKKHKVPETLPELDAATHEEAEIKTPVAHRKHHQHHTQDNSFVVKYTTQDDLHPAVKAKLKEHHIVNKVLQVGEAFGEKALTNPDAKRSASILTNSDCEFIILRKDDFLKIFARFSLHNKRKIDFLKANLPDMDQVSSRTTFEDFMYSVQQVDLVKGNIVAEEGYEGDKIYILAEGSCTVHKELEDNRPEKVKMVIKPRFVNIQVNEIGPGTMIGEELIFSPEKKYKYTVKVSSFHAVLYYIKASELKVKFPRRTITGLRGNFEDKEELRNQRLTSCMRGNIKELDSLTESFGLELNGVLKYLTKDSRHKRVSKLHQRHTEHNSEGDLVNLSDTELHRIKRLMTAESRNMKNIKLERNRKNNKTIKDYYTVLNKYNERHEALLQTDQNDLNKYSETFLLITKALNIKPEDKVKPAESKLNKSASAIVIQNDVPQPLMGLASQDIFITRSSSQKISDPYSYQSKRGNEIDKRKSHSTDRVVQGANSERLEEGTKHNSTAVALLLDKPNFRGASDDKSTSASNLLKADPFYKGLRPLLHTSSTPSRPSASVGERPSDYKRKLEIDDHPVTSSTAGHDNLDKKVRSISQETPKTSGPQHVMQTLQTQDNVADVFYNFQLIKQEREQPPNKREFIIRQRNELLSDQQMAQNEEITLKKLENMKKTNSFETGYGFKRFEFGSNRLFEQRTEERKRVMQTKIAQRLFSEDFKSPKRVPCHRVSNNELGVVEFLKYAVTPTKNHLYQKLETDLRVAILEKPKEVKGHTRSQGKPAKEHNLNEPPIDKLDPINFAVDPTAVKKGLTLTSWKTYSANENIKQLASQLAITNMKTTSSSRNLFNSTQTTAYKEAEPVKWTAMHQHVAPMREESKDVVKRSLKMKRQLKQALDSKRKILAWKDNFGVNLSASNTMGSFFAENSTEKFDIKSIKATQTDTSDRTYIQDHKTILG